MNINQTCNANWNGASVQLLPRQRLAAAATRARSRPSSTTSGATGWTTTASTPTSPAPAKAIADIYAHPAPQHSCIGRGFFKTGICGGYGDACTGLHAACATSTARSAPAACPTGIPWIDASCRRRDARPLRRRRRTARGMVVGEAGWDLDAPRPPRLAARFNFDYHTALEIATRLFFLGSGPVASWYTCSRPAAAGCARHRRLPDPPRRGRRQRQPRRRHAAHDGDPRRLRAPRDPLRHARRRSTAAARAVRPRPRR